MAEKDGRDTSYELRHEVAVVLSGPLTGLMFRAPEIHDRCGGRASDLLAKKVVRLSGSRALGCPVCGCPLERRFGEINRWHFAEARWASAAARLEHASHEAESMAHRSAKEALARSLSEGLNGPWEVVTEARLESGQRADVLARHASGTRVAFEVQLAPISPAQWRARCEAYARIGVPDYWLLGLAAIDRSRHALANLLADAIGQRLLYVGGETKEAVEAIPEDARVAPGAAGMIRPFRMFPYSLTEVRLSPEGVLSTPADTEQERRRLLLAEQTRREAERPGARQTSRGSLPIGRSSDGPSEGGVSGKHSPQPMPAELSERALKTAPGWAIEMHRRRQQLARQMATEEANKKPKR